MRVWLLILLGVTAAVGQEGCPASHPVTCYNSMGYVTGCCPLQTVCDMDFQTCAPMDPSQATDPGTPLYATLAVDTNVIAVTTPMVLGVTALVLSMVAMCCAAYHARGCMARVRAYRAARALAATEAAQIEMRRAEDEERAVCSDEEEGLLTQHEGTEGPPEGRVPFDLCRVCKVQTIDSVVFPCGHFVSCYVCARHLKRCPNCGETIQTRKKIFQA